MDFYSAYRQGFVRVAACTHHTPSPTPRPTPSRCCGWPVTATTTPSRSRFSRVDAVRLLDRGHPAAGRAAGRGRGGAGRGCRGICRAAARAGGRCAAPSRPSHLQHRCCDPSRQGARRGAEVLPADVPGVLRTPAGRRGRRRARCDPASAAQRCRSDPTCCSPPPICRDSFCTSRSARTCSCPVPPSAEAALAGATVLANLSGSPITIGRAEDRCLLARSASSRCLAAYVYAAAGEGSPPPTSRGTARR